MAWGHVKDPDEAKNIELLNSEFTIEAAFSLSFPSNGSDIPTQWQSTSS